MRENTFSEAESKFTKGEKCIFTHLVLTFVLIFILFIIYAVHLYIVNHTLYGIFSTRRSSLDTVIDESSGLENLLVGYLYLNATTTKFICNTLLLKPSWSLCTAHCVVARTEPDMAKWLFSWGLKYKLPENDIAGNQTTFATSIRRSVAHSLFNRETFANNIGLLEHTEPYPLLMPNLNIGAISSRKFELKNIFVIGWNHSSDLDTADERSLKSIRYDARTVSADDCSDLLSPVIFARNYEFCITLHKWREIFLDYGAVVFAKSEIIGIFSWGERLQKQLPMVVINVTNFQDWLKTNAVT